MSMATSDMVEEPIKRSEKLVSRETKSDSSLYIKKEDIITLLGSKIAILQVSADNALYCEKDSRTSSLYMDRIITIANICRSLGISEDVYAYAHKLYSFGEGVGEKNPENVHADFRRLRTMELEHPHAMRFKELPPGINDSK